MLNQNVIYLVNFGDWIWRAPMISHIGLIKCIRCAFLSTSNRDLHRPGPEQIVPWTATSPCRTVEMPTTYEEQAQEAGLLSDLEALNALDAVRAELRGRVSEVQLPEIVVVGNQSSGKSSVLESVSRVPLPRGQGTVTRCPIQLRVRQSEAYKATVQDSGPLFNPHELPRAIQDAVNLLVPVDGFSQQPVAVEVHQSSGPNLTLIDLPGLIFQFTNPNKHLIEELVETYLEHGGQSGQQHVIVCVLDATSDWDNAAAISYARRYDPSGERTLFVITKIDRVESGLRTSLERLQRDHLRNQSPLGYVLVRNRTQEELAQSMTAEQALQKEQDFFDGRNLTAQQLAVSHELRSLPVDKKGTPQLIRKLVQIQQAQVRRRMPGLRREIDAVIMEDKNSLARVPVYAEDEPTAQRELQNRLAEATRAFQKLYNGDYGSEDAAMRVASKLKNLMHALRPSIWSEIGGNHAESVFSQDDFAQKVMDALQDEAEPLPNMHYDAPVMKQLYVREVHAHILGPCQQLISEVRVYLEETWESIIKDVFKNLPKLKVAVLEQVEKHLDNRQHAAQAFVRTLISHAKGLYTVNPKYIHASGSTLRDINRYANILRRQSQPVRSNEAPSPNQSESGTSIAQSSNAGAAATNQVIDPLAKWWRLTEMEKDHPAAWALASRMALDIDLTEEERRVIYFQFLLAAYAEVVVDRVSDEVPLAIRAILVDEVLGFDGFTPDTTLAEVVSKHFHEAATVLELVQNPANLQERRRLQDRLSALKAAKRSLPA